VRARRRDRHIDRQAARARAGGSRRSHDAKVRRVRPRRDSASLIAFLGGTFDPIHLGHLHAARAVLERAPVGEVGFVLAARPAHRAPPIASIADRWAMLQAALAGEARLVADDGEMRRAGPSYTVETLEALRAQHGGSASLAWILGWDAYVGLATWHRFADLPALANLIVVRRPGEQGAAPASIAAFEARRTRVDALTRRAAGGVAVLEAPMLALSSTEIRARCGRGEPIAHLLSPA